MTNITTAVAEFDVPTNPSAGLGIARNSAPLAPRVVVESPEIVPGRVSSAMVTAFTGRGLDQEVRTMLIQPGGPNRAQRRAAVKEANRNSAKPLK